MSKDEMLEVDISELIVDMETEIEHSCGFESMDAEMKRQHKEIINAAYDKFFSEKKVKVILKQIDESVVTTAGFVFGEQTIECNALEKMNVAYGDIDSAYLYAFGIKVLMKKCWKKVHFLKNIMSNV